MEKEWRTPAKRALLERTALQYQSASRSHKQRILARFMTVTEYDPFVGQWEQILSWIQADPTSTSGDLLRELQALFPGRYQPQQVRTLQRGMRKIRAHLLTTREEQWQQELIPTTQFQRLEAIAQQSSSPPLPIQPTGRSIACLCPMPLKKRSNGVIVNLNSCGVLVSS